MEELDDKELYDRIEKAGLADRFLSSPQGKLLDEAAKRITEKAINRFALSTTLPDSLSGSGMIKFLAETIELRLVIRKYKYGIFEEMKMLIEDGIVAEDELNERHENLDSETGIEEIPS